VAALGLAVVVTTGVAACASPPNDSAATVVQVTVAQAPVLFEVWVGDKAGYIDRTGSVVIQPQFASAYPFSEGLAAVQAEKDGLFGFIDTTGKMVWDGAWPR
jgi:hypothetical protein